MPLWGGSTGSSLPGPLGFFGASPVQQPGTYTTAYTTTRRDIPAYTPSPQTSAYTGGLLNLLDAGRVADLNSLRVAYENLRVFAEATAQQHNQLVTDLKALGLIG